MEFLLGLVVGAILGVVVDRVFTYVVERRPFVKIQPSFPHHFTEGRSLSLHITNEGLEPLPPYTVALFNPHRGTLSFFQHETQTDRLPGQTDVFTVSEALLLRERDHLLSWLTKSQPLGVQTSGEVALRDMKPEECEKWFLRLIIQDSENRVLYENNRVGVALVEILLSSLRKGMINATGEQAGRAQVTSSPWARWRDWRRTRRELRRLGIEPARTRSILPAWLSMRKIGRLFRRKRGNGDSE